MSEQQAPTTTKQRGRPPSPRAALVEGACDATALLLDNREWDRQEWPALHQVGRLFVSIAQAPGCTASIRQLAGQGADQVAALIAGDRAENVRNARAYARLRALGGALDEAL